jgi:hypothetical protein
MAHAKKTTTAHAKETAKSGSSDEPSETADGSNASATARGLAEAKGQNRDIADTKSSVASTRAEAQAHVAEVREIRANVAAARPHH